MTAQQLFEAPTRVRHPARFTPTILDAIRNLLPPGATVLDPFAGTGRIHELEQWGHETVGIELEPEWANMHPKTIWGNALHLPFRDESFDAVATSPCYGNRYADHHRAHPGWNGRSYTHDLGRPLHGDNSGSLQWGQRYREFHERAWAEALRVLKPGGVFILNISDHVRGGEIMPVTAWHRDILRGLGLTLEREAKVPTPRMRYGANASARVAAECVMRFSNRHEL